MNLELHQLDFRYETMRDRCPVQERRLLSSLATLGQLSPIMVLDPSAPGDGYIIVDGFRRTRALRELGRDTVSALALQYQEPAGLLFVYHQQRASGRSALEEARLIQVLSREHGLCLEEIARQLGRSKSWVSRRLGLLQELPGWLQDEVGAGHLQCHAAVKYLLPLARANKKDAETLAGNIAGQGLTTREVEDLYRMWRCGDAERRRLVVEQPLMVLKAQQEVSELDEAEQLRQDMSKIISICRRASRRIPQLKPPPSRRICRRILSTRRRLSADIQQLCETIDQELSHDQRADAANHPAPQ